MKVLVTGGAGFIGSHVAEHLIHRGYKVIIVDNCSSGCFKNIPSQAMFYETDIDSDAMTFIFKHEQPEAVFHLAAHINVQNSIQFPIQDAYTNIIGSIKLMELCGRYEIRKFIYSSSAAIYGEPKYLPIDEQHPIGPISPYGLSKYVPEQYLKMAAKKNGYQYAILRYANVYGDRQIPDGEGGVISIFIDRLIQNQSTTIFGDGSQTRDFIHVDDVARANVAALEAKGSFIVNISNAYATSVNELYRRIQQICDVQEPKFAPKRIGDIDHSYLCNKEAIRMLDWKPRVDLREGLERTVQYARQQIHEACVE